mgnify:CR=1 FL=1
MKMSCSVIQDLLPSYADNICSKDTRELVEEHVAECGQCRDKLEKMKNTEIIGGKAAGKQIDYLKKVRSTILHKEWLGKFILVILTGIAYVGLFAGSGGLLNYEGIPSFIFSALIFSAAILAGNYRSSERKKTAAVMETVLSAAVFLFVLVYNGYLVRSLANEGMPFPFGDMEARLLGPIYATVLKAAASAAVLIFIKNTFGKGKNAYATTINITSIGYIVYANDWLYHMDSKETTLRFLSELELSQAVLAAAGIIACFILRKYDKKI